jgi:hypothetical protein
MNGYNSKLTSSPSSASLSPISNEQQQQQQQQQKSNNKRTVSGFSINDLINDSSSSSSRSSSSPINKKIATTNEISGPTSSSTPLQNYTQISPSHNFHHQWPSQQFNNNELNLLTQHHHNLAQPPPPQPPQPVHQTTPDQQLALHYHLQREQALNIIRNGTRYFDPRFNMQCNCLLLKNSSRFCLI